MTQVFHVVGGQGSGKSQLIMMMAAWYEARGMSCAGVDSSQEARELVRAEAGAEVMFLEYLPHEQIASNPGDHIIRLERVAGPGAAMAHAAVQQLREASTPPEHPLDIAAQRYGGRRALADSLGVSVAAIGNWKVRGVPFEYCPKIERLVPSVTRKLLRPDDYHEMWPELADATESAPAPLVGEGA